MKGKNFFGSSRAFNNYYNLLLNNDVIITKDELVKSFLSYDLTGHEWVKLENLRELQELKV